MSDISFPEHSMSGIALEYANLYSQYLETPKPFFYFAFLTCLGNTIADKVRLEGELATQPRLYTVTLGESSDARKSTGNERTSDFFISTFGTQYSYCSGVNSAEGLGNVLDKQPMTMLYFDELQHFINKASIQSSVLLQVVNTLFGSNRVQAEKSQSSVIIDPAYLSILGASTLQTYEKMWTPSFIDIGFPNRLWIVPAKSNKRVARPKTIPEANKASIREKLYAIMKRIDSGFIIPMTINADHAYIEWYDNLERSTHTKRLEEYALRFMTLYAISEGTYQVDQNIVKRVLDMVHWQLQVRQQYDPIDADNKIAHLEQLIVKRLHIEPHSDKKLKDAVNAYRYGLYAYQAATKHLADSDIIRWNTEIRQWKLLQ